MRPGIIIVAIVGFIVGSIITCKILPGSDAKDLIPEIKIANDVYTLCYQSDRLYLYDSGDYAGGIAVIMGGCQ